MKLILASSSPRRSDILEILNIEFEVVNSYIDEDKIQATLTENNPVELVGALSKAKSQAVAGLRNDGLVLGADTVVAIDQKIYGKPVDAGDLREMMIAFSNKTHQVLTGVALTDASSGICVSSVAVTDVSFRKMNDQEIVWYEKNASYKDKAGGYAIQEHAALFITKINGCYYNVVGLPVQETLKLFSKLNLDWKEFLQKG